MLPPEVRFEGLNAPSIISAGAPPQTPLGEITAVARTTTWKGAGLLLRGWKAGKGKGGERLRKGREGKGEEEMKRSTTYF